MANITTISADRHNAYGWIRLDAAACHLCGRKEYATPVDGFQVQECTRCSRLICENHADTDADCDQDGYFTTEWVCKDSVECERLEPSQYCDIDGFGLNEDGDCERCQRSAADEQAEGDREDMEWEL